MLRITFEAVKCGRILFNLSMTHPKIGIAAYFITLITGTSCTNLLINRMA